MGKSVQSRVRRAVYGLPPYSPGKPIWEVEQELGLQHVIKLASNENPFGPSPKAQKAMANYLAQLHRYPDANAYTLRRAISAHCDVAWDQVMVGNGADELITLISETFLAEGDEVIIPHPTFSEYAFGTHLMDAKPCLVGLSDRFEYDLEAVQNAVTTRTKLIFLCSPNNPTGTYIRKKEFEQFLATLSSHAIVVFDAAYSDYATAEDYTDGLEYVKKGCPIIALHTFSKIYGLAGIRVGFGISTPEIVGFINRVKEPFNVNVLAQVGAAAALDDREHVSRSKLGNESGRNELYQAFESLGICYLPSMSNFILIHIGEQTEKLYDALLRRGIIVRPGKVFGLPEHLRISVGSSNENRALVNALREIWNESGF